VDPLWLDSSHLEKSPNIKQKSFAFTKFGFLMNYDDLMDNFVPITGV